MADCTFYHREGRLIDKTSEEKGLSATQMRRGQNERIISRSALLQCCNGRLPNCVAIFLANSSLAHISMAST